MSDKLAVAMLFLILLQKSRIETVMVFTHGGRRPGQGRKRGEQTKVVRLPISVIERLNRGAIPIASNVAEVITLAPALPLKRPLYLSKVAAGFPSPGDNYVERRLDLNEHLVRHKEATFFVRVNGDSMTGAGILDGDLLIVDRSITRTEGRIVVAAINGELVVKKLIRDDDEKVWLVSENPDYAPIELKEGMELMIWGVVTNAVHAL